MTGSAPGAGTRGTPTDRMSEALGLRTDGSAQSLAQRDKHKMVDTVRAAGPAAADQVREVLVQSHLAGTEYIVDTVSVDGRAHGATTSTYCPTAGRSTTGTCCSPPTTRCAIRSSPTRRTCSRPTVSTTDLPTPRSS
ncbi:hypothetical protein UO65_0466 [Actinokineospora spheciospongiae]|uniref:Uncharacterized protein n=1 Tax=Actinokineospora spheciospongiae TaxID=909613 RepID=W7ITB8_9PSEU|nr:hypothetical protein [Actinokineospora spheciospongiae]EWC64140.1 hypothetical protein UO65_0466 [Actinokineospora spheciospongiae]